MPEKITKKHYFLKEKELIGSSTVDFDGPVIIGGEGVIGYDLDGKKFLDFTGQISLLNTGYGPEEVVSAIFQQARAGAHSCISADYPYLKEIVVRNKKLEVSRVALAKKLIEITDKIMPFKKRVFFEVSGATAVNLAAKIAQITHLRKRGIKTENFQLYFESDIFIPFQSDLFKFSFLAFRNAFHGRHGLAQLFTNSKTKQFWAASASCAVGRLPFPANGINSDVYKIMVERIIYNLREFAPVVAFVFEPVQGEGGINIPDGAFLKDLISYLRSLDICIIADEVQTGLGRTGKMWACEHFGIEPDMLVTSKSLGAGLPIGAVIVNDEKFPDLEPGTHSGSHHATPLACAAAIANIDKIIRENLAEQSANHGIYLLMRLKAIKNDSPSVIYDVRGLGLMIGIEFYSAERRDKVLKSCKENGLLLAPAGAKAIRMTPPLIVTIPEIDKALRIFKRSLMD